MSQKVLFSAIVNVAFILLATPVFAQPSATPSCRATSEKSFDFWIGEWDIESRDRPPGAEEWKAGETWIKTRVRSELGGCAIIEESIDKVGNDTLVVGMSMTSFNPHLDKYQHVWVDRDGNTWEYLGGWEGDQVVLYLEPTDSEGASQVPFQKTTLIRMVFDEIEPNRLVWRYQYSTDEGQTWTSTNEAVYTRAGG